MFRNPPQQLNPIMFLFLVSILFIACGTSKQPALSAIAETEHTSDSLSRQDRIEIFEDVWKTINEQYYDPSFNGVNWQEVYGRYRPRVEAAKNDIEFYRLFEEMLPVLRDAHTVFKHPLSNVSNNINPPGSVGISLGEVEGKTAITAVEADSDVARAGVKSGMILRSVNGKTVEELYAEIRSRFAGSSSEQAMKSVMHSALLYGGFLGASRTFGIEGFDGKTINVPVANLAHVLRERRL